MDKIISLAEDAFIVVHYPRIERTKKYNLVAILIIALCATVCGVEGKVVAINGKTLRGSFDNATGKGALHLISAWVEENSLILGHVAVEGKQNEITTIQKLLRMLQRKGAIVTIDAIGCQKEIIRIIRQENKADYVFSLKTNKS